MEEELTEQILLLLLLYIIYYTYFINSTDSDEKETRRVRACLCARARTPLLTTASDVISVSTSAEVFRSFPRCFSGSTSMCAPPPANDSPVGRDPSSDPEVSLRAAAAGRKRSAGGAVTFPERSTSAPVVEFASGSTGGRVSMVTYTRDEHRAGDNTANTTVGNPWQPR